MDKEEILKKSRAEKKDEREAFIKDKALRAGFVAFWLIFGIMLSINDYFGQDTSHLSAMWAFSLGISGLTAYRHSRKVLWLILGIGWIIFSGLHLWEYLQFLMG